MEVLSRVSANRREGGGLRLAAACALLLLSLAEGSVEAQISDVTWADSLSDWTLNGSWVGGVAPIDSLFAHRAVFGNTASINAPPTLGGASSIAGLSFDNTGADWSMSGAGLLRLGGSGIAHGGGGATTIEPAVQAARNQSWNVASGGTLQLTGNLLGAATVTLTGAGTKQISGTNNMFHGMLANSAGTLVIDNPLTALRAASLTNNTALSLNGGLRVGELSGSGALTINGANELRMTALRSATYGGALTAGDVTVAGRGRQTLTGATSGVSGDVRVLRGAELIVGGAASFTNAANDVILRGGQMTVDNQTSAQNRYLSTSSGLSFTGGGTFVYYSKNGNDQTLASAVFGQGHSTVVVNSSAIDNWAALVFSSTSFAAGATLNVTGTHLSLANRDIGSTTIGSPSLLFTGQAATSYLGPRIIVNGSDFARYNTSGPFGVQTALTDDFSVALSTSNALLSASAVYNSATAKNVQSLKISANGTLDLASSGGLVTEGVILAANRTFTIRNTGAGTGNFDVNTDRYVYVADGAKLAVAANAVGSTNDDLVKSGAGTLILQPRTVNTFPGLYINEGAVQAVPDVGLAASAVVRLRGGVWEVAGGGTLAKNVGTAAGNINWQDTSGMGSGGFSAAGGALTVELNGAGDLIWGQTTRFVQNDDALLFGSQTSDSDVVLVNNLALNAGAQTGYEFREIYVDGSSGNAWKTVFSGVVSSAAYGGSTNGQLTDLMKTGTGTLELTGNNTYVGGTIVTEGKLLVGHTNALGDASQSGAYVQVGDRGATDSSVDARLLLSAPITFDRDIAIAEGNGARVLGGIATGTATFAGNVFLNDLVTLRSEAGAVTQFTGVISGDQNIQTNGPSGTVVLSGANTYSGVTTIFGGTLQIDADVYSGADSPIGRGTSALQLGPTSGAETATLVLGQAITFQRGVIAKTGTGATGTLTLGGAHTSGVADFTGTITLQRSAQLTSAVGGTTRFSGAMTGTGGITKIGDGIVRLDDTTTYTGATIVNAGTLEIGGSTSSAAATTVNGGAFRIVAGGSYDTASTVIAAAGSSVVVDSGGTLSDSVTGAGTVTINGLLNGSATVQSGGTLGGGGIVTGNVSGAGTVSPGNSPGILDVAQIDPTSGMDFLFQFTQANTVPNYLSRTDSGNDVLHLTHATTPFLASLTSANKITLDFQLSQIQVGDVFIGGFFTNQPGPDFYGDGTISAAEIEYLMNGTPLLLGPSAWQFQITTISQTGVDFGSGYGGVVDGRVMQVTVTQVPEPSSLLLVAAAAGWGAWRVRRRRRD